MPISKYLIGRGNFRRRDGVALQFERAQSTSIWRRVGGRATPAARSARLAAGRGAEVVATDWSEDAVELRIAEEPDGGTRLELADGGHGFSDEALASAFMPFFTTKRAGSGMGHTLCREIVHAHGGTISVANRMERGAQVTVVLPGPRRPDSGVARSRARLTLSRH